MAVALTGDQDRAEQAVVEAFRHLGRLHTPALPSAVDVMGATRLAARTLSDRPRIASSPSPSSLCPLYRGLDERELDVVALAVIGECTCREIATVMHIERDQVHQALRTGLVKIAANRDGPGTIRL